jgi:CheY-like chemotaxis protein/anti-sigma regulatory factor (Ser/Thr protein kinase)
MEEALRLMSLRTDRKYLVYVISLIIDNALKFTDRGNVDIKMEGRGTDLVIHIQDTGPGIEARDRQVIFNKFRQLEDPFTRRFGGTGIGLTIAGEVVRLMGGTIEVESEPGKGSRFTIRVPGLEKSGATTGEIPQTDERQILQDKQVLVVEDEELNFLLLKELLKSRGAELLWARNGREALELTERHSSVFLVLMDIRMPVMNGLEATRVLKANNPALPVIALTAYNMQEDKEKAYEAGCDAFLTKPVNKETLFATIRKVVSAG